ncbi:MAG: glycosyltransferase family 39 protein [bacterium]|nr:glycosyltransferase family 39 protein [bacterium]
MSVSKNWLFGALFCSALFLFLFRLGAFPFLDYDEATYALVFSESFQSGDFLSFTRHGQLEIDKPPLLYWLMAGSVWIFGENEFAMRLPAALLGLAAVWGAGLVAWQLTKNKWKALLASAILLTIGDFIFAARQVRMDVPVAAAIIFALYFFIRGWDKQKWYLGFGICLAAGALFKSVIGLLIFPVILIFSAVYFRWDWLKSGYFWVGEVLALLLIAPWFWYETAQFGTGFLQKFFTHSITSRFTKDPVSWLYYPKFLFQLAQPWITVFALILLGIIGKFNFWRKKDPLAIASLGSVLFIFVFFEAASFKLFYYLEPIYPFLAIFVSCALVNFFETAERASQKRLLAGVCALLIIGFVSVNWQIWEIGGGQGSEYALAKEEKDIGQYLAAQNFSEKVYSSNFYNYETIYYYGRKKNFNLTPFRGDLNEAPFFLIIPNSILRVYDLDSKIQEKSRIVYTGEILTMFEAR